MSCVPCVECGEGSNITAEDLDRWTDSLSNVLASPEGRAKFKQYLENANMEEALHTLDFWEQCCRAMPRKPEGQDSPPHPSSSSSSSDLRSLPGQHSGIPSDTISEAVRSDFKKLYNYAFEYINLDRGELRQLRQLLKTKSGPEAAEILSRTKAKAAELLRDEYDMFRRSLLKERRLLQKC